MITSITTRAIPSVGAANGLQGIQQKLSEAIEGTENYLLGDVKAALDPNNNVMNGLPKPVDDLLSRAESGARSPETRQLYETLRSNMNTLNENRHMIVEKRYKSKVRAQQIELSVKAVSKTMSGIQQLLSSQ